MRKYALNADELLAGAIQTDCAVHRIPSGDLEALQISELQVVRHFFSNNRVRNSVDAAWKHFRDRPQYTLPPAASVVLSVTSQAPSWPLSRRLQAKLFQGRFVAEKSDTHSAGIPC